MYWKDVQKYFIDDFLNEDYTFYAHLSEDGRRETVQEHTYLCEKYFLQIIEEKGLSRIFLNFEELLLPGLSPKASLFFRQMILHVMILHDLGKLSCNFQKQRMDNDFGIDVGDVTDKTHAFLSSMLYLNIFTAGLQDFEQKERIVLADFMLLNGYVISRHHSDLENYVDFERKFQGPSGEDGAELSRWLGEKNILYQKTCAKELMREPEAWKRLFKEAKCAVAHYDEEKNAARYIYTRLVLSLVFASDFYATAEFMNGTVTKDAGSMTDIDSFYNLYCESDIYKTIRRVEAGQEKAQGINALRCEMFLEAEGNLLKEPNRNIYYLEAPTGSGKSNVALNLGFLMHKQDAEKTKLFYVYPFNTLVEQNIETLQKHFGTKEAIMNKITVINSMTPIKYGKPKIEGKRVEEQDNYSVYEEALLNRQFLNYPMVLTTHVTLFTYLFGVVKENIFPLHQIANSVIVLDEIQSYKNEIWGEIITFLSCYARILNIKIIIMSATLPDLDVLTLSDGHTGRLLQDREKYFSNPVFRDRVKVNYFLMDSQNIEEDLLRHVIDSAEYNQKILVEFIFKSSAGKFFRRLKESEALKEIDCEVELLTGEDKISERKRILRKVRETSKHIILVATQVVEAGVDIDMDVGYKNMSLFDSEEQFMGRINRSCRKEGCVVYFFLLDDAHVLYSNDFRQNAEFTLKNPDVRKLLVEKNFPQYYENVLKAQLEKGKSFSEGNIRTFFSEKIKGLKYKDIEKRMRLIDDDRQKTRIFMNTTLMDANGVGITGRTVWEEYKALLHREDLSYAEKRVKLSYVMVQLQQFMYEITGELDFVYNDQIGDLYYIEDGEQYFEDGKLIVERLGRKSCVMV